MAGCSAAGSEGSDPGQRTHASCPLGPDFGSGSISSLHLSAARLHHRKHACCVPSYSERCVVGVTMWAMKWGVL